jgi:Tumour suppressor p53-binding protein-1 Tudor/Agenet domain
MHSWKVGDRVFAYWDADGYWYPATITKIAADDIAVRYDDGEEEMTTADFLEVLEVGVGDEVESWWASDEEYIEAVVVEVKADSIQVQYDDNSAEWVTIGNLRAAAEDVWSVDDRVFAYYEDDGYWYPATITAVNEDEVEITYDDGSAETTTPDYLDELDVAVGDPVESLWAADGLYHESQIVDISGDRIQVEYDDGSLEWTDIGHLRVAAEESEEEE